MLQSTPSPLNDLTDALPAPKQFSARYVAIETLRLLKIERSPVNRLLDTLLQKHPTSPKDRQLANNIVLGVLRNQESLDRILQFLCKPPLKKLDPFVHQALNVGLYQILFLDRIPDSAAVNESVKAAQAARLPKRLHGFINGVLRNGVRKRAELEKLLHNPDTPLFNHPSWMVKRWQKRFGYEKCLAICQHNNEQPTLILQSNSCCGTREDLLTLLAEAGITTELAPFSSSGIFLPNYHGPIQNIPGFHEGLFQVQDQGAQLLCQLMTPIRKGGYYLDGCAGSGGKSSILLQRLEREEGHLHAVEPDNERAKRFKENMQRLHPGVTIPFFQGTLQTFSEQIDKQFDGIFLDVPCSGTGVTGRHPDIRWNRIETDLAANQATQLHLLATAAPLLTPGGLLVYATCSLEEEENERVISSFLENHPNFSVEDCEELFPDTMHQFIRNGFFSSTPQPGIDGFFGARLRKNSTI